LLVVHGDTSVWGCTNQCLCIKLPSKWLEPSEQGKQTDLATVHHSGLVCLLRAKTFIYIDGKAMVSAKSIPDAVYLLYATYYALWLEYPMAALGCYKYLESEIFEQKAGKMPAKLIRLLSSCAK